jgi:nitrite reductase (NO-forming)
LEILVERGAVAVAIAILFLVSIVLPFQLSNSTRTGDQIKAADGSLTPKLHNILLIASENMLRIAPDNDLYPGGVWYNAMTFNGTVPGPLIVVNQGDMLRITLRNEGELVHSLNFHAGFGPTQALSGAISTGENKTWTMTLDYPGAFLYHCDGDNLNGMWEHIAGGMYGGIVVHSPNDKSDVQQEFYVAFSEIYSTGANPPFSVAQSYPSNASKIASGSFDIEKFVARNPDLILTNGMAFRYIPGIGTESKIMLNADAEAFHVRAGELTRWHIFNAGPRNNIAFNFGAGMVKEVPLGNSELSGDETTRSAYSLDNDGNQIYDEIINIPPGSGTVIEVTFPEPGTYFGNDHDVGSILYGAGFVVIAD